MANIPNELRKIQQNKPPYASGQRIEAAECPACGAMNEQYKAICYACGAVLTVSDAKVVGKKSSTKSISVGRLVIVGCVGYFLLWIVIGLGTMIGEALDSPPRPTVSTSQIVTIRENTPTPGWVRLSFLVTGMTVTGDTVELPIYLHPAGRKIQALVFGIQYTSADFKFLEVHPGFSNRNGTNFLKWKICTISNRYPARLKLGNI